MGVDLTILPQDWKAVNGDVHANSVLSFSRDRVLWDAIHRSGIEVDVGGPVVCHLARADDGEYIYGTITENPYGSLLTRCLAGELSDVVEKHDMIGSNIWILAALKAMNPDRVIVMYWH